MQSIKFGLLPTKRTSAVSAKMVPALFLNYAENTIHQFDMAVVLDAGLDHLSSVASFTEYIYI